MSTTLFKSNILCEIRRTGLGRAGRVMCRYDTIRIPMRLKRVVVVALWAGSRLAGPAVGAQASAPGDEPLVVGTDHPRLFLRPGRLRLLRRERDRTSMRWQQFENLMGAGATMP